MYAIFLIFLRKLVNWEWKDNFKTFI